MQWRPHWSWTHSQLPVSACRVLGFKCLCHYNQGNYRALNAHRYSYFKVDRMLLDLLLWRDMTLNLCLSSLFFSTLMKLSNITSRVNYKRRLKSNVFHFLPAESDLNTCHRTTLFIDYHYHQSTSTGFQWQLSSHDLSSFLWDSTDFSLITTRDPIKVITQYPVFNTCHWYDWDPLTGLLHLENLG